MARAIISHPTALLGRHVVGSYRYGDDGPVWPIDGIVECITLPAPGFASEHDVSIFVGGDFVSVRDCISLDYAPQEAHPTRTS